MFEYNFVSVSWLGTLDVLLCLGLVVLLCFGCACCAPAAVPVWHQQEFWLGCLYFVELALALAWREVFLCWRLCGASCVELGAYVA